MISIGIIIEDKTPPDTRVAISPEEAQKLKVLFPNLIVKVQSSNSRCFKDEEYQEKGIEVVENVDDCNILLGIKEVAIEKLIAHKTYLFFSHTIKKQAHNKKLLQTVLEKNIRLIDYECLVDEKDNRVIAFGRFAGIVGAHNGIMAYGIRTQQYSLKRAFEFKDLNTLYKFYSSVKLPAIKIVVTGGGRVAQGVLEVMKQLNISRVSIDAFTKNTFNEAVFVQLDSDDLYQRKDGKKLPIHDFYENPQDYLCNFKPFYASADIMINAVYWHPEAPLFFSKKEMNNPHFNIKTIADITCDINGSIPATTRATTIEEPVMGYNAHTEKEESPYQNHVIDIMSIDNLPNELPRDASAVFGEKMVALIIPELLKEHSDMIEKATIAKNGMLTKRYEYLSDYVA